MSSRVLPSCIKAKSVTLRVLRLLRPARWSPSAAAPSSLPADNVGRCHENETSMRLNSSQMLQRWHR